MVSLWIIVLSLTVLEVSAQTFGQNQIICQLNPEHCCVCWPNEVHRYCTTPNGPVCEPDDYDDDCRTNPRFKPEHDSIIDEWELMLDSHDYQNLVLDTSPAWIIRDVDGDGFQWTQRGGICQFDLRACHYQRGPQDNWVFTQHIKYPAGSLTIGTTEIFINITFRFSQCTGNPACTNDFVTLYRFDTNAIEPLNRQTDPDNYIPLFGPGTETTDSQLQQVGSTSITVVRSFLTSGDYPGFYLGIRDTGTCGQVQRIYVYYIPCKKLQDGLVNYPEVIRPPAGSGPNIAEACCAPNSHNTTSRTIRAYSVSDGRCDRGVMCVCDAGYRLNASGTACVACPAGTYLPVGSQEPDQCLNCPMNTVMDMVAAPKCPCLDGYFRDVQTNEGPGIDCTSPPSPVRNLGATQSQIRDTSVTVTWTRPDAIGRNDFYYIVEYSDPDNFGNFLPADPTNIRYFNSAPSVTYRVPTTSSGLKLTPFTDYTIRVTVHNGVSDQDSENEPLRRVNLQVKTKEGVPSVPVDVQPLAGVVVWGPPAEPNGIITGYDVRFSDSSRSNPIIPKGPSDSYHRVVDSDIAGLVSSTTMVQVRARTSVGAGVWSTAQRYTGQACPPAPMCPTTPPPETCPTPTPGPSIRFMLRGRTYLNNTIVLMSDIGETDNALLCVTDRSDCCINPNGEFYYPDNTGVGFSGTNPLYRNRGTQLVRLNRRNNDLSAPTGVYRCEIPDSSGAMQNIYITIVLTAPDECPVSPTTTDCPMTTTSAPVICTCPEPTACPPCATCPPTPEPNTCPPPVTCPPPPTPCPATPPPISQEPDIKFMLRGQTYLNNTVVLITDIGEDTNALLCMTDRSDCCTNPNGEFYYPDNTAVGFSNTNPLYRNRGPQVVRLNRRTNALSPTGVYRCEIPDSSGRMQNIYINIIAPPGECPTDPDPLPCPTTSTPTECPTVTTIATTECPDCTCTTPTECPTTPPPTDCPTCPTVVTPPTQTITGPSIKFMLRGQTYLNNTVVLITDIGEDTNALLCMTDRSDCCSSPNGEFYYPDNHAVGFSNTNPLYRNRGPQVVRLNRRNNALSPTGVYRCEIPDSSGRMQNIYINIIAPQGECPTDPDPLPCPTTSTPTECPTVTTIATTECPDCTCTTPTECPTTPPPTDCPTCPTVVTPPTQTITDPSIRFMLRGRTYLNNTIVLMSDIGETDNALLCVTDRSDCCSSPNGEFYYPDNTAVGFSNTNPLYRNRGLQVVRLNRRNNALSAPTGVYRCEIPDSSGTMQNIYINIIGPVGCPSCPTTSCPDNCPICPTPVDCPISTCPPPDCNCPTCGSCPTVTLPVDDGCTIRMTHVSENIMKADVRGCNVSTSSLSLNFISTGGPSRRKRQANQQPLDVTVQLDPGQTLVQIPRGDLQEGVEYTIQVQLLVNGMEVGPPSSSVTFTYTASGELSAISGGIPEGYVDAKFVAIAIIVTFILTAIIVALLVIALTWLYITCKVKAGYYSVNNGNGATNQTYGTKNPYNLDSRK